MPYGTNYATLQEWVDDPDPVEDIDGEVEEMYYDKHAGELHIGFNTPDERFFSLAVAVEATEDWNEFVESLPKWEIPE